MRHTHAVMRSQITQGPVLVRLKLRERKSRVSGVYGNGNKRRLGYNRKLETEKDEKWK